MEDLVETEIVDVPSSKDDQQLSEDDENEGENASDVDKKEGYSQPSRKRALTSSVTTPVITKKKKQMEILVSKVDGTIKAMTKPLEIVDNDAKMLRDAMACWNLKFKSESTETKLAFTEEWQQNPRAALQFVLLEPEDRQCLVRKTFPLSIEEGQNRRKDKDLDDDISEFLEELDEE